jgi:hypothetical protein
MRLRVGVGGRHAVPIDTWKRGLRLAAGVSVQNVVEEILAVPVEAAPVLIRVQGAPALNGGRRREFSASIVYWCVLVELNAQFPS